MIGAKLGPPLAAVIIAAGLAMILVVGQIMYVMDRPTDQYPMWPVSPPATGEGVTDRP